MTSKGSTLENVSKADQKVNICRCQGKGVKVQMSKNKCGNFLTIGVDRYFHNGISVHMNVRVYSLF